MGSHMQQCHIAIGTQHISVRNPLKFYVFYVEACVVKVNTLAVQEKRLRLDSLPRFISVGVEAAPGRY